MRTKHCDQSSRCPVEACLDIIGGKWKGVILFHLLGGKKRFNELQRLLPNVTQRILVRQLRELEADRIVVRTVYPEVPPKVEYSLSESGMTLEPILRMLREWGVKYLDQELELVHQPNKEGFLQNSSRISEEDV